MRVATGRSPDTMFAYFALGNVLLLASLYVFTSGFLSSALFPSDISTLPHNDSCIKERGAVPPFNRVIFLLIDALRPDFVYSKGSGFGYTQRLISSGAAIPFTGYAAPPTVTLPRIKAITTGSIPGFADVMGNLDQSDASTFASHDSWVGQLRASGGNLVFYGDDTWLRLFNSRTSETSFFMRYEGVNSFLTSDYTEVDQNVTRHVARELQQSDWNAMILHYLGVDHIGHMSGPRVPHMFEKHKQMDDVVKTIFESIETHVKHRDTLLVLLGDHGMNEVGNHGGNDPGETESALLFASPKFRMMSIKDKYECPTLPQNGTKFHYYRKVEQQDVVPTLSGLIGLPIPRYNIGRVLDGLRGMWPDEESYVHLLKQNAQQLWKVAERVFDPIVLHAKQQTWAAVARKEELHFTLCVTNNNTAERLACLMVYAEQQVRESKDTGQWTGARIAYEELLTEAQRALTKENRPYNVLHMAVAMVSCWHSIDAFWPLGTTSIFYTIIASAYGVTLFVSTSEKSEQYFWYSFTSIWIVYLAVRAMAQAQDALVRCHILWALSRILASHCVAIFWTFLGPFIEHTIFARYTRLMWFAMLVSYLWNATNIIQHTLADVMGQSTAVSLTIPLVTAAFIFKLVQGLEQFDDTDSIFHIDQIILYKTFVALIALTATIVCILVIKRSFRVAAQVLATGPALPERLHHLLTLFLMTQSRSANMLLFICQKDQSLAFQILLQPKTLPTSGPVHQRHEKSYNISAGQVAVSILTFSHTYFFCFGGSNSISSIDLSNAYNGISDYNIVTVAVLLFSANWAGPIWWCSAACNLVPRSAPHLVRQFNVDKANRSSVEDRCSVLVHSKIGEQTQYRHEHPWLTYLSTMSASMASNIMIVMVLCTVQREDPTVWIFWGSKYLYGMFWVLEWHLVVSLGFSSILRSLGNLR
ncbi:alkaline phosphatase-like protein [Polychaeton citri CBS 116435]|uniref:GPI ethanolamine phosphate transferase 2 n=1 Tax=Polychaeton citri CBS 116435 TaxID=1314669 RepID=A0A9P4UK76_9PEZI|nr:alkaline phosphatase-like protein [Polychaeton citri CBS 116435]